MTIETLVAEPIELSREIAIVWEKPVSEIVSKGWNIHYQTMGDRNSPPLLMIPGYSHRIAHWGELPKMLSQRLFLILVDCRGMGQSEVRDEPYSLRDEAEDMCAVLASIDVPRAHVVGFSRGSFVAQELALTFPNSVLSLILGGSTHRVQIQSERHLGGPKRRNIPLVKAWMISMET